MITANQPEFKIKMHYDSVPFEVHVLDSQPDVEKGAHIDTDDFDLLPASYRNSDDDVAIPQNGAHYLRTELLLERLNKIHPWLWTAGRPMPPRALHHQLFLSRSVVITERMDMHLVWSKTRIFLKPIPRFLLDRDFWVQHLLCPRVHKQDGTNTCANRHELAACSLGFLFSYTALVSHESDFHMAQREHLIPRDVSWPAWKTFVRQILEQHDYSSINRRYWYGELRLSRLDKIYQLTQPGCLLRGYSAAYYHYSDFFNAHLATIASFTIYAALVLAAMQVGLSTETLAGSPAFQDASWGFTVFAILAPLIAFFCIFVVFIFAFASNWAHTRSYERKRYKHMGVSI